MRDTVVFILRRFIRDLPWLVPVAAVITAGFIVVPLVLGDASSEEALETGIALSIGMVAILPTIWLRFRILRELGGRRSALAYAMAAAWGGSVILLALPILNALDA